MEILTRFLSLVGTFDVIKNVLVLWQTISPKNDILQHSGKTLLHSSFFRNLLFMKVFEKVS